MFTYRGQKRIFKFDGSGPPKLPSKLVFLAKLGSPSTKSGVVDGPQRLVLVGNEVSVLFNSNTGRTETHSGVPPKVETAIDFGGLAINLTGNVLSLETTIKDLSEMDSYLLDLEFALPSFLNIVFRDAPIVKELYGELGAIPFRVVYKEADFSFFAISQDSFNTSLLEVFTSWHNITSSRVFLSLYYFHVASRLSAAGFSLWEFMPETILNMAKSLQVLFGDKDDAVRAGLRDLGYTNEEIEGDFIPLMKLRNHWDVGHLLSATPDQEQLQILYKYLAQRADCFRDMFQRLLKRLADGAYQTLQEHNPNMNPDEQRKFDQLMATIKPRVSQSN